jgi:hypothetical protein
MDKATSIGVVSSLLTLLACGDVTQETHTDVGEVCLTTGSNGAVEATVHFGCIAGGCTSLVSAECAITLDGERLIVTASATTETKEADVCTLECRLPTTDCNLEDVSDGDYTVEYGDHTVELTVPWSSSDPICAGTAD